MISYHPPCTQSSVSTQSSIITYHPLDRVYHQLQESERVPSSANILLTEFHHNLPSFTQCRAIVIYHTPHRAVPSSATILQKKFHHQLPSSRQSLSLATTLQRVPSSATVLFTEFHHEPPSSTQSSSIIIYHPLHSAEPSSYTILHIEQILHQLYNLYH
jgi:hypothetical protein